jgi:amicyanin
VNRHLHAILPPIAGAVVLASCGATAAARVDNVGRHATATTITRAVPSTTEDVTIADFKFAPAALMVKMGTTIVWTNKDAIAHNVAFSAGAITSSILNQKDQFSRALTAPGTYTYICTIHPFMHGSVTVTP